MQVFSEDMKLPAMQILQAATNGRLKQCAWIRKVGTVEVGSSQTC
jgi:hypothetical protein